ncbi:thiamine pyrophosphate-dependent enzyme, partial [Pseudomonas aeruginosa]|uniref:thiamine pyrophosphate-dependent enzyme n=1 Tax=Pseudomonas aeruginosa TaxID=287 RepID=UPI003FD128FA
MLTTCARKATSRCPGKLPSSPVPDGLFSVPDRYPQLPSALSYAPRRKASRLSRNEPISRQSPFARLAEVIGFHGRKVTRSEELETAVQEFLAQPGPALLDVHT